MAVLVAIDIASSRAKLVTAEIFASGAISIVDFDEVDLKHNSDLESATSEEDSADEETAEESPSEDDVDEQDVPSINGHVMLSDLVDNDIDHTLAVLSPQHVLFDNLHLPFKDPKKLEQIVPLQVQDSLPFDIDEFIIDAVVLGEDNGEGYEILTSLIPQADIATTLAQLRSFGADPKILTTKASAITALPDFFPRELSGTYALLLASKERSSLALFVDNKLKRLREFPFGEETLNNISLTELGKDLSCSISRLERDMNVRIETIFVSGTPEFAMDIGSYSGRKVKLIDFGEVFTIAPSVNVPSRELTWALGLFANETRGKNKSKLINFRRGPFAYKPAWGNFLATIKEELFYIILAVVLGIGWAASVLYSSHSQLSVVEDKIESEVRKALPGERVPPRREVTYVEDKLSDIETQLRGLGSLSSLSPLESLRALATAIDSGLDIKIESMSIGYDELRFGGSVVDIPSVGRLNSALEKQSNLFCRIQVDTKGQAPGTPPRQKFQAQIGYCK